MFCDFLKCVIQKDNKKVKRNSFFISRYSAMCQILICLICLLSVWLLGFLIAVSQKVTDIVWLSPIPPTWLSVLLCSEEDIVISPPRVQFKAARQLVGRAFQVPWHRLAFGSGESQHVFEKVPTPCLRHLLLFFIQDLAVVRMKGTAKICLGKAGGYLRVDTHLCKRVLVHWAKWTLPKLRCAWAYLSGETFAHVQGQGLIHLHFRQTNQNLTTSIQSCPLDKLVVLTLCWALMHTVFHSCYFPGKAQSTLLSTEYSSIQVKMRSWLICAGSTQCDGFF